MIQPESLRSQEYQPWSRGRGIDVWAMICAAITGDLETIKTLVEGNPDLINCEYEYFTPIHFAVRENQRQVVDFLLQKGVSPFYESGESLVSIAGMRGYTELTDLLESLLRTRYHIIPEGNLIAAAIKTFNMAEVQAIIESQPERVHAADERGNQPIHWAVLTRQINIIDYLLQKGADIHATRPDGAKPIDLTNGDYHYRSWYRDLPPTGLKKHEVLIGYLMARSANCDISIAAKIGYYDRVLELLDQDPALVNRIPGYDGYYSGLPLRCASAAGHIEIVKLLLERGANVNEPEPGIAPFGGALHAAIGGKHFDIVKLLLERGANSDAEVESSGDCLFMAKWVGAPKEIVDLVASYSHKASIPDEINQEENLQALSQKLEANSELPIDQLMDDFISGEKRLHIDLVLRYQPDALSRKQFDPKAWWDAGTMKSPEYAKWLFERGLSPNRRNWLGITLLHRCAAKGDIEMAATCLDFGADINALETEWSSSPLGWAAREGKTQMVEWLLGKEADVQLPKDEPWAVPLAWAVRKGHADIIRILEKRN